MGWTPADVALDKPEALLPLTLTNPKMFPLNRFHQLGVAIGIKWHGLLDLLKTRRLAG